MKYFVCGGRDYNDYNTLKEVLDAFRERSGIEPDFVLHGDANGADNLGGRWARENGIQELKAPANWDFHGKSAGFKRNCAMRKLLTTIDHGFVFPGGKGTEMMRQILDKAGIPYDVIL